MSCVHMSRVYWCQIHQLALLPCDVSRGSDGAGRFRCLVRLRLARGWAWFKETACHTKGSKSVSLWPQFPIDEEQHGMSLSVQHSAVASLCKHVHLSLDCWNQIKFWCSCGFRTCHSDCSCMCAFREFSLQQYLKNPTHKMSFCRKEERSIWCVWAVQINFNHS